MRTTAELHPTRRTRPGGRGPAPTAPRSGTRAARRAVMAWRREADDHRADAPGADGHRADAHGADPHRADPRRPTGADVDAALHSDALTLERQGPEPVPAGSSGSATRGDGVARPERMRTVARVLRGKGVPASDAGMATAEYAIATVAAVGFAGLLMVVLRSGEVQGLLLGLIRGALSV